MFLWRLWSLCHLQIKRHKIQLVSEFIQISNFKICITWYIYFIHAIRCTSEYCPNEFNGSTTITKRRLKYSTRLIHWKLDFNIMESDNHLVVNMRTSYNSIYFLQSKQFIWVVLRSSTSDHDTNIPKPTLETQEPLTTPDNLNPNEPSAPAEDSRT